MERRSEARIIRSDKLELDDDNMDLASSHASVISSVEQGPVVERTTNKRPSKGPQDRQKILNIGMVGSGEVGKTSLIKKFIFNEHIDGKTIIATIGIDYFPLQVNIAGEQYSIQIWDPAGQERFRSLTKNYYNQLDAVILVFSMTEESSMEAALRWLKEIQEHKDCPVIIVANKSEDVENVKISDEVLNQIAEACKVECVKTSACSGF